MRSLLITDAIIVTVVRISLVPSCEFSNKPDKLICFTISRIPTKIYDFHPRFDVYSAIEIPAPSIEL